MEYLSHPVYGGMSFLGTNGRELVWSYLEHSLPQNLPSVVEDHSSRTNGSRI